MQKPGFQFSVGKVTKRCGHVGDPYLNIDGGRLGHEGHWAHPSSLLTFTAVLWGGRFSQAIFALYFLSRKYFLGCDFL